MTFIFYHMQYILHRIVWTFRGIHGICCARQSKCVKFYDIGRLGVVEESVWFYRGSGTTRMAPTAWTWG